MQGVSAWAGTLNETQVGMAYHNLQAMGRAGRIYLTDHPRAQHQFSQAQYAIGKRVMVPEGGRKYLADARAICAHYTVAAAAAEYCPPLLVDPWQDHANGGPLRVRSGDEGLRDIRSLFGLPPFGLSSFGEPPFGGPPRKRQ